MRQFTIMLKEAYRLDQRELAYSIMAVRMGMSADKNQYRQMIGRLLESTPEEDVRKDPTTVEDIEALGFGMEN